SPGQIALLMIRASLFPRTPRLTAIAFPTPEQKHARRREQAGDDDAANGQVIQAGLNQQVERHHGPDHLCLAQEDAEPRPPPFCGGRSFPGCWLVVFHGSLAHSPRRICVSLRIFPAGVHICLAEYKGPKKLTAGSSPPTSAPSRPAPHRP